MKFYEFVLFFLYFECCACCLPFNDNKRFRSDSFLHPQLNNTICFISFHLEISGLVFIVIFHSFTRYLSFVPKSFYAYVNFLRDNILISFCFSNPIESIQHLIADIGWRDGYKYKNQSAVTRHTRGKCGARITFAFIPVFISFDYLI